MCCFSHHRQRILISDGSNQVMERITHATDPLQSFFLWFVFGCLSFCLFHQKHSLMKAFSFANNHHLANAVFTSSSADSDQSVMAEIKF